MSRCILAAVIAASLVAAPGAVAADESQLQHFESKVRPLLLRHCGECHGADEPEGALRLDLPEGIAAGGQTGAVVVPGHPERSRLIQAVRYTGRLKMPPEKRLRDDDVAELVHWVQAGAALPEHGLPVRAARGAAAPFTEEEKSHWAFQPISDPVPPPVNDAAFVRTGVDPFVLARLKAAGLAPSPPAERSTLLRRVTFDLIGLPPTTAELDAFLADDRPDAFARVVDRLLASPHYGERWGRHWLDLVRYADSNGGGFDYFYPNAFRYRDYVTAALNQDKPFNEFLIEQLAGDLLPQDGDIERCYARQAATGFLTLAPKSLGEHDKTQMVMDVVDDQIDVLGRAVLGLTLACARCHDHKFDPISTEDYYALAGIFKSTVCVIDTDKNPSYWPERALARPEVTEARDRWQLRADANAKAIAEARKKPDSDERRQELKRLSAESEQIAAEQPAAPPMAMVAFDAEKPGDVRVHVSGEHDQLGELVSRRFPRILAGDVPSPIASDQSGRLELARWLVDPAHPLTARVLVNRIWLTHFGQGLVRSPDNFGKLGEPPTHPELLDWLAQRFVESGWSIKSLHRLIVLSGTYQMRSTLDERSYQVDGDNRLLWRFPRRRLDAEELRDAMLAVSGELDRTLGGTLLTTGPRTTSVNDANEEVAQYASRRRSIYLPVIRSSVYGMFQLFDFGDPNTLTAQRTPTTVATQALFMLNSPLVREQAGRLADRLLADPMTTPGEPIQVAYRLALARPPDEAESTGALALLDRHAAIEHQRGVSLEESRRLAYRALCQSLFCLNEFIHVD